MGPKVPSEVPRAPPRPTPAVSLERLINSLTGVASASSASSSASSSTTTVTKSLASILSGAVVAPPPAAAPADPVPAAPPPVRIAAVLLPTKLALAAATECDCECHIEPPRKRRRQSAADLRRIDRALSQRMYLVEQNVVVPKREVQFRVLGSTGNVYTVVIGSHTQCDCPDALKGNICKHVMFVLIRVLRYDGDIADAYDDDELDVIFANQREQPGQDVVANAAVRQAYERLISGKSAAAERRDHDADCPICMENMADDAIELLAYCSVCGQNIHRQCYAAWTKTAHKPTCVMCRQPWIDGSKPAGPAQAERNEEGYVNLGDEAGVNPERPEYCAWGRHGRRRSRYDFYGYYD